MKRLLLAAMLVLASAGSAMADVWTYNERIFEAGEKQTTHTDAEIGYVVPTGLTVIEVVGNIRTQDRRDPNFEVCGGFERFVNGQWKLDMAFCFRGGDDPVTGEIQPQPHVTMDDPRSLTDMAGQRIRGFIIANKTGRVGWQARIE